MYGDSIFDDRMDALMHGPIDSTYRDNADEDVFYDVVKNGYKWKTRDGRIIPLEKLTETIGVI